MSSELKVDTISEKTISNGVAFSNELKVDTISEKTTASGVTIDGLLIKDGAIPSIPGGKLLQVVTNTDTGITSSTGSSSYITTTTLDTITPVAAGSYFLVTATGTANNGGDSKGSSYTIMAKVNAGSYAQFGTLDLSVSSGYSQLYINGATDAWIPTSIQVFDTVTYSLTDTITFAVHLIGKGPGTDGTASAKWGHNGGVALDSSTNTITIMEVAG